MGRRSKQQEECSVFMTVLPSHPVKGNWSVSSHFSSFPRPVQLIPLWSARMCGCTKDLGFAATKTNFRRTAVRHWSNNPLLMALSISETLVPGGWGPALQSLHTCRAVLSRQGAARLDRTSMHQLKLCSREAMSSTNRWKSKSNTLFPFFSC